MIIKKINHRKKQICKASQYSLFFQLEKTKQYNFVLYNNISSKEKIQKRMPWRKQNTRVFLSAIQMNHKKQNIDFLEASWNIDNFQLQDEIQKKTCKKMQQFHKKHLKYKSTVASKQCLFQLNQTLEEKQEKNKYDLLKREEVTFLRPIIFQQLQQLNYDYYNINRNQNKNTLCQRKKQNYRLKKIKNKQAIQTMDQKTCAQTKDLIIHQLSNIQHHNHSDLEKFNRIYHQKENFIKVKKYDIWKDFKINEKIGEGAYGEIYSAVNIHNSQIRAIKILKNKPSSSNSNGQSYFQEFNLLRKLDHPNILKLFKLYQSSSKMHIVTELCTGKNLSSYLKAKFSFSKAVKQQILHQIFKAINYLDELNIIHRDLKPDNIIFTQEITEQTSAEDIQIKIIDFGLSLECAERKIKDWSHMGTKNYMSPETFNGIYSHKGDSWACGIIMHLLLLNSNPFLHVDTQEKQINLNSYKLNTKSQKWAKLQKSEQQLLQSLLHPNYVLRSDMKVALQSKFFYKKSQNLEEKNAIIQQLKRPCQTNGFIDFIESYLSFTKVSLQKRLDYSKIFYSINKSNSGQINLSELSAFLQLNNSEEETYIFKKINKSGKGLISFEELIASLSDKRQLLSMENLKDLFRSLDINKNNSLDKEELRYFIKSVTKEQLQKLYLVLSKSQKRINFERFQAYIQECMYSS